MEFGWLLRHYRTRLGLTQEALADRADLSPRSVFGLEHGETRPQRDTAERLARSLALSREEHARFLAAARPAPRRSSAADRFRSGSYPDAARPASDRKDRLGDQASAASVDRPAEVIPNNLPYQITSFIGREQELLRVTQVLSDRSSSHRLLTLTGPGGCGKTRLALEVAVRFVRKPMSPTTGSTSAPFLDGVWLVELAPVADRELVPWAVASVLGVREQPHAPLVTTLTDALRPRRLLLVLDNCEHVLEACATLVDALLRSCPDLRILVTSRQTLGITGEVSWRVPSLSTPPLFTGGTTRCERETARGNLAASRRVTSSTSGERDVESARSPRGPFARSGWGREGVEGYDAVRLFVDRAAVADPDFQLDETNAAVVGRICQRLDGIPLAIELAAARVRSLTVEEIERRLDDRFTLLTRGSPVALPRHRTLRALVDWSYELLSETERALFRRLAVFAGSFSLDAVEAIAPPLLAHDPAHPVVRAGGGDVLEGLSHLVEKSLVLAETRGATTRYRLLETLREYARECLDASGEAEAVRARHARFYVELAERVCREFANPRRASWLDLLDIEIDNLRAALAWGLECDVDVGLRVAGALGHFWRSRGFADEERNQVEALLAAPASSDRPEHRRYRARGLVTAGTLAQTRGDTEDAVARIEESVSILRALEDQQALARALGELGIIAYERGDFFRAKTLHEESLAIRRDVGDAAGVAETLAHLGIIAANQGEYERAEILYDESLASERQIENADGIARALAGLGLVAYRRGDVERAGRFYEESLHWRRVAGDRRGIAHAIGDLAAVAAARGDDDRAEEEFGESIAIYRAIGYRRGEAWVLIELGSIADRRGDGRRAAALYEEGLALHREIGNVAGVAYALMVVGLAALRHGRLDRARALFVESASLYDQIGDPVHLARCIEGLAEVAVRAHSSSLAARLFGSASSVLASRQVTLPLPDQRRIERLTATIRAELGADTFAAAWAAGASIALGDVLREGIAFPITNSE